MIERSLDAQEDLEFWQAVSEAHAHISEDEYVATQSDATLSDDLADHNDDTSERRAPGEARPDLAR